MEAVEYFFKDFEWDELRADVENDPLFCYDLLPFESSTIFSSQTTTTIAVGEEDSTAWKRFHIHHSSGKFFNVLKLSSNSPSNFFFGFSFIFLFGLYWLFGCQESLGNVSKPKGN